MVLRRCLARSKFDTTALPSVVLWVVDFFALFHEILYFCNFTPLDVVPDLSNSFQHSTRINTKVQALPIEGKPPSNLTSGNLGVFFRWWQQKLHCFNTKPVRQVLVISSFRPTRQTWRWGTLKIVWAAFWRPSRFIGAACMVYISGWWWNSFILYESLESWAFMATFCFKTQLMDFQKRKGW